MRNAKEVSQSLLVIFYFYCNYISYCSFFFNSKRSMPFRVPDYSTNERQLLDEIQGHLSTANSYDTPNDSTATTPNPHLTQLQASNPSPKELFSSSAAYGNRRLDLAGVMSSSEGKEFFLTAQSIFYDSRPYHHCR